MLLDMVPTFPALRIQFHSSAHLQGSRDIYRHPCQTARLSSGPGMSCELHPLPQAFLRAAGGVQTKGSFSSSGGCEHLPLTCCMYID